jgi:peptide subunit release factor 1 (eRF1)
MFYYCCGDKFVIEPAKQYLSSYKGNIVFANGEVCLIYYYDNGTFKTFKNITANLQKRQTKGGQSAVRIARLAEETRHKYVTKVIDYLNKLKREEKTLLFGSKEITKMIKENKTLLQSITYKGFLQFNTNTILDTKKWCELLEEKEEDIYDKYYSNVLELLEIDVDRLDFDKLNKNDMKYYLGDNSIPFPTKENKYYDRLCIFEYIGVKYYSYEL